jgi:hypothetical protein
VGSKNQGGTLVTRQIGLRILLPMPEAERAQIGGEVGAAVRLEIDAGEPIRGHLSASGMGALPFYGWLELVAAIQAVRHWPVVAEAQLPLPPA